MEGTRLGVILFIASEANFFALLVAAYIYYHHATLGSAPSASNSLDVVKTGLFSIALFLSSATLALAARNLRGQRHARGQAWLALTILLGGVFIAGQAWEYAHLLGHGVTLARNLFGTTFFTLTGFHGLHVVGGLVMLGILFGLGLGRASGPALSRATHGIALYWHFVDLVWVVIFSVVYLWSVFERVGSV